MLPIPSIDDMERFGIGIRSDFFRGSAEGYAACRVSRDGKVTFLTDKELDELLRKSKENETH